MQEGGLEAARPVTRTKHQMASKSMLRRIPAATIADVEETRSCIVCGQGSTERCPALRVPKFAGGGREGMFS